ncbi:MAG: MFS transporter [Clostridiales bacterium]|nr:MFS transporter [Clostridiales bacterium]
MTAQPNYRKTLLACYLGFITQAISANFAPLLFLTFKDTYGIPLEKIALIPMAFFMTQLLIDFAATKFVDRIGYRTCVVCSQVLSAVGLALLAVLPELLPDPFIGILIAVVLYAMGAGLIEVLISPIVEACPFENKAGVMSLLHSFYCWGSVGVILGSTLFFAVFGVANWRILALLWAVLPFVNTFNFLKCPIERLTEDGEGMKMGQLFRMPLFWLMALLMVCSGASEISMAQWASAFTESAMGVSKTIGDLAGPCLFAVLMGISRVFYGKMSEKLDLTKTMLGCGALCIVCYLLASLSSSPVLGLMGCALCGISVGIMWPGTLSISAQKCPKGGTVMFALLALAGDLGGSIGPSLVGSVSSMADGNLKMGLLVATFFPVLLIAGLVVLKKWVKTTK